MTTRAQRAFLKVQLLETQQLREMAGDHPLMSVAFAEREAELREQLDALPPGQEEAGTVEAGKIQMADPTQTSTRYQNDVPFGA